jgi:hypothetical protein
MKKFRPDVDAPVWKGGQRPYDIIKEGAIAILVVTLLTVLLAVVFGSPDDPAITIKKWSNVAPVDFAQDALSQLNGTSETATYGPPYNHASVGQELGPFSIAKWIGVHIPIDSARDFVLSARIPAPPTATVKRPHPVEPRLLRDSQLMGERLYESRYVHGLHQRQIGR